MGIFDVQTPQMPPLASLLSIPGAAPFLSRMGSGGVQQPSAPTPTPPIAPPAASAMQQASTDGSVPVGTIKNYHVFTGGDPKSKAAWEPLQGQQFLTALAQQSPAMAARVQAASEGRLAVPGGGGMGANSPDMIMFKNALAMYDPQGMDSIINGTRAATRKNFSGNGEAMQNIRNLNQAIGHLGELNDNIPNVAGHGGNGLIAGDLGLAYPLNMAQNALARGESQTGISQYDADRTSLANELASVFKGKGVSSESEIAKYYDLLDPNKSSDAKAASVRELSNQLHVRLNELADQYNQGMGTNVNGFHFLNPDTAKTFQRLSTLGDQNAQPQQVAAPNSPTQPQAGSGWSNFRAH